MMYLKKRIKFGKLCKSFGIVALASLSAQGCKQFEEEPASSRRQVQPTVNNNLGNNQPYVQVTQQPSAIAPTCDPNVYVCYPDPKLVELCKTKQTDVTLCEGKIEKSLYQELQQAQESSAKGLKCTEGYYIKTVDPGSSVNVRSSAEIKEGNIVGSVVDGDPAGICVVSSEGGWTKILLQKTTPAFVSSKFVTTSKPAPRTSTTQPGSAAGSSPANKPKELPNGGVKCPTGYFAAKGRTQFFKHPDYYPAPQPGLTKSGDIHAGLFFCASNVTQTVAGTFPYVMVKILLLPLKDKNTEYWMECKYLADGYRQKAGCP